MRSGLRFRSLARIWARGRYGWVNEERPETCQHAHHFTRWRVAVLCRYSLDRFSLGFQFSDHCSDTPPNCLRAWSLLVVARWSCWCPGCQLFWSAQTQGFCI